MKIIVKIFKIVATVIFILIAVVSAYLSVTGILHSIPYLRFYSQFMNLVNIFTWTEPVFFPILRDTFNFILSVISAVFILKNRNETAAIHIFCFGNAACFLYMCINEVFYRISCSEVVAVLFMLLQFALIVAIAIIYRQNCGKHRSTALIIITVTLVVLSVISFSFGAAINRLFVYPYLTPYFRIYMFVFSAIIYLPLLLICIAKRFDCSRAETLS